jgi:RHS repeat-associated protein
MSDVIYLHGDHLGSTNVATDYNGAKTSRQTYYAFGAVRTTEGTLPTDYTFTGQKRDEQAGLNFYNARYYDGALGRFVQPDTIIPNPYNPQALNRYSYVYNNPLRYRDPSGHCPLCVTIAVGTAIDIGIDFIIANATDTDFNFGESLAINGGINIATAGIGGKLSKAGKIGGLAEKYGDNLLRWLTHADDATKVGTKLSKGQLEALLKNGIKNPNSKEAVIGLHKGDRGYTELGRQTARTFLDLDDNVYDRFVAEGYDWWELNKAFLDEQIKAGKTFLLETPYEDVMKLNGGEYFKKEMDYLLDKGYKFNQDGTRLIPGGDVWDISPMWNW